MANEAAPNESFVEKLLFYTTAFFILLAIFSLFAFLFLVPFVIEPAFTTIFMKFNEEPVTCVTSEIVLNTGQKNCSWTSCKEGCTKEIYNCTQIRVDYKTIEPVTIHRRVERAIRADYNYVEANEFGLSAQFDIDQPDGLSDEEATPSTEIDGNHTYEVFKARLLPNVKGCGYPPILLCLNWTRFHAEIGANFSCYYSRVDPGLVITDLDMEQVYMNIVYAVAIPIPSFIISVIYLIIAYFFIYNEEPQTESEIEKKKSIDEEVAATPGAPPTSGNLTPASEVFREDMASFGHQLKVAMADDISRDSVFTDTVPASSFSLNGSSTKMMTTSIITPPGPIADV